jgi:hypothetical protein
MGTSEINWDEQIRLSIFSVHKCCICKKIVSTRMHEEPFAANAVFASWCKPCFLKLYKNTPIK